MADFDAPISSDEDAKNTVSTALTRMKKLEEFNDFISKKGYEKISIGIGIDYGVIVAGNVYNKTKDFF